MKKLIALVLSAALSVGIGLVPASAATSTAVSTPPEVQVSQTAPSGLEVRLDAAVALSNIPVGDLHKREQEVLTAAQQELATTSDWYVGSRIVDERLFRADENALSEVAKLGSASPEVAAALETFSASLVESDFLAVVSDFEVWQEIALLGAVGIESELHKYGQKMAQYEDRLSKRQFKQAVESLHQAWTIANSSVEGLFAQFDADNDLLFDWREAELGTDPASADSDADGLPDMVELLETFTDPASAETEPGVPDQQGDIDLDGLSNADEVRNGTLAIEFDTDGDTLSDGFEVLEFGSNANLIDTDGDGLRDDSEYRLGTNPNSTDTDADGLLDADETYTSTTGLGGASVAITGVGDVAASVTVTDETTSPLFEGAQGMVSQAVDFSTDLAFDSAQVTFTVDPGALDEGAPSDYAIGYYDEETGLLTPIPTVVDPVSGTATATTDHFTTFVLFYIPNWQATFSAFVPGSGVGGTVPLDVALVLDSSGSMTSNDRYGYRKTAAKSFVDALIPGDRVAVIDFDGSARVYYPLGTDFTLAKAAIDRVNSSGSTNIGRGVDAGIAQLLTSEGREDRAQVLVLLTDGTGSYSSSTTTKAINNDIQIYTIGLGSGVNATFLEGIATATGGQYFPVADAEDLPDVFSRILDDLGDTDTDGDLLLDRWEIGGMPTGSGRTIFTDPYSADTDGDGIPDGVELKTGSSQWQPNFFHMTSDPSREDSDGDGLADDEEIDLGLPPLRADKDGDGLKDGLEYELGYDPGNANPDGDRFDDSDEYEGETDPFFYDPTVGDRVRALVGGFLLGEVGYWLADNGTSIDLKIAYTPLPTLVIPIGSLSVCDVPFVKCEDLTAFRPVDAQQVEYLVGMVVGGFIPFYDIVVAIRDTVGSAMQGEWGWAAFELVFGAVGFFVPLLGDVPGIVKDFGKWVVRAASFVRAQADALRAFARMKEFPDDVFKALLKGIDPASVKTIESLGSSMSGADLRRIIGGGRQSAKGLAAALSGASAVKKMTKAATESGDGWFDSAAALAKNNNVRGREAELFVNARTGGEPFRFETIPGSATGARYVDNLVDGVATEIKTGDGRLTSFIKKQIAKDQLLLSQQKVDRVVWEFFPSSSGLRTGPDEALAKALKDAGIDYIVWLP